ncbi:hypothetical protein ABT369_39545 [Dactylosporangium sp. NPDC000244]|uniref:hypothetical protein n=1 Tax=Dactylosporangium sp. NPDC000244 TaxID=3154365 RepID=UPI00332EEE86
MTFPAVSVTGHRDLSDVQLAWLRTELDRVNLRLVHEFGTADAATGMARGTDLDFGWSALFAGMAVHAHIPYPQQPNGRDWTDADRDSYRRLLERCTSKREYGRAPDVGLLFARNDGLLDFAAERSGVIVAVWDGRRKGGTYDTVKKAAKRGLPVIHFDIARLQVHGPGCSCVKRLRKADQKPLELF